MKWIFPSALLVLQVMTPVAWSTDASVEHSAYQGVTQWAYSDAESDSQPVSLQLKNDNHRCVLQQGSETPIALEGNAPCYWLADLDKKRVITEQYPDQNVDAVAFVGLTPIEVDAKQREYLKLAEGQYCTSQLQGVLIKAGQVYLAEPMVDAPACVGDMLDEKLYRTVAVNEHFTEEQWQERVNAREGEESVKKEDTSISSQQQSEEDRKSKTTEEVSLFETIKRKIDLILGKD